MLDFVSTISNFCSRQISRKSVISTSICLAWGVIQPAKTLLIVAWLSSYNFYGVTMGQPIDICKVPSQHVQFTLILWYIEK